MHILLAGATGVLGRRLIPLLVRDGHQVTALTRRSASSAVLRKLGANPLVANVFERDSVIALTRDARPDAVVHQLTDLSGGDLRRNAELREVGTRNLVDAALAADVQRIVAQSIAWAYVGGELPATEEESLDLDADEPRRTTVLGVAALESAVREVPGHVLLRYGLLYGPGTWFTAGGAYADRLRPNDDVTSFVHVDDAARAAVSALVWDPATLNIADDEPAPGREWVPVFCRAVHAPEPPTSPVGERSAWARGADNSLVRKHFGWSPRHESWRTGFTESPAGQ
ncbi:NAD(P)-dependent oxidoreductase [Kutzneria viridogrisea]|uniref:Nucleoside-diphosphate-sugar epimerase n=1 Tax=Kutzneria viridogrisea TaxID=47990 RepID=A0ABR6BTD1_9PSEU|nr:nucleoside-diphosphate-sugar epimerase [Kutzneria viridogrisea]